MKHCAASSVKESVKGVGRRRRAAVGLLLLREHVVIVFENNGYANRGLRIENELTPRPRSRISPASSFEYVDVCSAIYDEKRLCPSPTACASPCSSSRLKDSDGHSFASSPAVAPLVLSCAQASRI
jgi:hypothetical protein